MHKSGNNECRKCPKNAKNIRKNIPCDTADGKLVPLPSSSEESEEEDTPAEMGEGQVC